MELSAPAASAADTTPPWARLQRLIIGYRLTQALGVAAQLGVADLVAGGVRASVELAQRTGVDADALYRVLRLLASEGVFAEAEPGAFDLTPLANLLRADVAGSMRARAIIEATEWFQAWAQLPYCVASGRPSFEQVFGAPPFAYYADHPTAADLFNATMVSMTTHVTPSVVGAYDFGAMGTVVDVGGGHGALLAAILQAYPHLRGVLFDLPHVLESARPYLTQAGVADRCDLVAGDFFHAVPAGADAYLLKFILDDWDDAEAARILQACRRAATDATRLLVVEMPIRAGNDPFYGKWTDVNMLVLLGGRERTEGDYAALFATAGFRLNRVITTASEFSIVEGVPA